MHVIGTNGGMIELASDADLRNTDATLRDIYIR
jgi:hypothetical protein